MNLGYLISMIGLIEDIGGGILLAKSVYSRSARQIFEESTARWGTNVFLFESGIQAAVEARFSVPLLILGFVGQLSGNYIETIPNVKEITLRWTIFAFLASFLILLLLYLFCHIRKKWWINKIRAYFTIDLSIQKFHQEHVDPNKEIIETAYQHTKLEKTSDEADVNYLTRCREHIKNILKIVNAR